MQIKYPFIIAPVNFPNILIRSEADWNLFMTIKLDLTLNEVMQGLVTTEQIQGNDHISIEEALKIKTPTYSN